MTLRTCLVFSCALALVGGCASSTERAGFDTDVDSLSPTPDGTSDGSAAGAPASGPGGTGDVAQPGAPTDPSAQDPTSSPSGPGASDPSAPGAVAATPDEPCNEDLDVFNGRIVPDLGVVPDGGSFTGNPEEMGPFTVVSEDFQVLLALARELRPSTSSPGEESDGEE